MRTDLAQIVVTALYVVPGIALLVAARVIAFRTTQIAAAVGLAYLVGVAVMTTAAVLLLAIGIPLNATRYLVLALLLTAAFAVCPVKARWQSDRKGNASSKRPTISALRRWLTSRTTAWWIAAITIFVIAFLALAGFATTRRLPVSGWDGWSIWGRKGLMLFYNESIPTEFFASKSFIFMQPDYPLLVPIWESIFMRFAGAPNLQALHAQFWIMLVAAIWAAGFLAHRAAPAIRGSKEWAAAIWAPLLGVLLVNPNVYRQTSQMYADIPMAIFALSAAFCCALWIETRRRGYLVVAAVLLGGLANIKNEGLTTMLAILAALLVVRFISYESSRWRSIKPVLLTAGYVVLSVLPWRIWIAANDVHGLVSISDGLSPKYLWEHKDRIKPSLNAFLNQLIALGVWTYVPALAIVLGLACLIIGVGRRVAVFYSVAVALTLGGIIWGYVVAPTVLGPHLELSADRLVDGFVLICMAAVLHLTLLLAAAGAGVVGTEKSAAADATPAHD